MSDLCTIRVFRSRVGNTDDRSCRLGGELTGIDGMDAQRAEERIAGVVFAHGRDADGSVIGSDGVDMHGEMQRHYAVITAPERRQCPVSAIFSFFKMGTFRQSIRCRSTTLSRSGAFAQDTGSRRNARDHPP